MDLKDLNRNFEMSSMCLIAKSYGTDKWEHGYTKVYNEIMGDKHNSEISIFEIGVYLGNSIKLWHQYFTKGKIYGIDNGRIAMNTSINAGNSNLNLTKDDDRLLIEGEIASDYDFSWIENFFQTNRIKCFIADQRSKFQLNNAFNYFGCNKFDFIIDDGHHYQEHQQKTLSILFPNVKSGGYYIIEDICDFSDMLNGSVWGQKREDCTDSTDYVFTKFLKDGVLESDYMSIEDIDYITKNISDIFLYDCCGRNDSPISGKSKLLVIKKK